MLKKLLILSGKGGTGKTTVASSFIHLLKTKTYADCDVDAPNLHITATPHGKPEIQNFYGLPKAKIDLSKCIECKKCLEHCKFDAISYQDRITIDPYACEGCGTCKFVCPTQSITMEESVSGQTYIYHDEIVFSTAKLKMGAGASGKLVSEVKKNMDKYAKDNIAIIDGSPGIGCPVIASMTGIDMVLVVTEPTVSGISDLQRILETANYFKVKCAVCINKYDINRDNTEAIKHYCNQHKIEVVGMIPFDKMASKAINEGKNIVEMDSCAGRALRHILEHTLNILNKTI